MKKTIIILLALQIFGNQLIKSQSLPNTSAKNSERKFVHITEFGFLLGKQAPINNVATPYYANAAFDAKYAPTSYSSYYYPYPYYYGDEQYSNFTLTHFTGYKINTALAAGLSGGFDYYRSNIITPISMGIRTTLLPSRRISPILNMDGGYGFLWKNTADKNSKIDKEGGLMLNPSAGLRIKLGEDGSNINISVGYKIQKSKMINNIPDQDYYQTEYRSFNRLSIRLGFGF